MKYLLIWVLVGNGQSVTQFDTMLECRAAEREIAVFMNVDVENLVWPGAVEEYSRTRCAEYDVPDDGDDAAGMSTTSWLHYDYATEPTD